MIKISIDTEEGDGGLEVSDKEYQKAQQIANRARTLLIEAGWGKRVEIIKATLRKEEHLARTVLKGDFQMVFSLPPNLTNVFECNKQNKFKMVAQWNACYNYLFVREDKPGEKHYLQDNINLQNEEVETIARVLVEVMRTGIQNRQADLEMMAKWLKGFGAELKPLTKALGRPK